jgi:hypothetical protein
VYSQCLPSYWSHAQFILSVCHATGHTHCLRGTHSRFGTTTHPTGSLKCIVACSRLPPIASLVSSKPGARTTRAGCIFSVINGKNHTKCTQMDQSERRMFFLDYAGGKVPMVSLYTLNGSAEVARYFTNACIYKPPLRRLLETRTGMSVKNRETHPHYLSRRLMRLPESGLDLMLSSGEKSCEVL